MSQSNLSIRLATLSDLIAYTDLLQTTYEFAYTKEDLGLTSECFSKKIFASNDTQKYLKSHLINTPEQKTWLAFADNKLIGSITVIVMSDHAAELTGFYVHPNFQNKGIGKRLYSIAAEFAGNRDLQLDIYVHNINTIALYRKWGWEIDTSRGDGGYFYRHWAEWPEDLQAKCMYMIKKSHP